MEHSESITKLSAALLAIQDEMPKVQRNRENPFYHSRYADLDTVWDTVKPVLKNHGVCVMMLPTGDGNGAGLSVLVAHNPSGEWVSESATFPLAKSDPQGAGSAITYARRYVLCTILGVIADEDDDGNAGSQKPGNGSKAPPNQSMGAF